MLQQHSLGEDSPVLVGVDFNSMARKYHAGVFDPEVICVQHAAFCVAEHCCPMYDQRCWPAGTQPLA